ncbi:MAG: hypothetical protein FJ387_02055 [Verrucomicrobia bacterium]|nr:hypothetical protein [Verrucomicrobiota bacterium]
MLHNSGALDDGFSLTGLGVTKVEQLLVTIDGHLLMRGWFSLEESRVKVSLVKVDGRGQRISSFERPPGDVICAAELPDGRLVVAIANRIWRLLPNGSPDATFTPVALESQGPLAIHSITALANGDSYVTGRFDKVGGRSVLRIARLKIDGSVDPTFDPGWSVAGGQYTDILDVHVEPDGRLVIAGEFETYRGVASRNIARLLPDGSPDPTFDPGTGFNGRVTIVEGGPDGELLAAGWFTGLDGAARRELAKVRLGNPPPTPPLVISFPVSAEVFAGRQVGFQVEAKAFPLPAYQWFKDGHPIPAATGPALLFANPAPQDSGDYSVRIENALSAFTSTPVRLTVYPAPLYPGAVDPAFGPAPGLPFPAAAASQPDGRIVVAGVPGSGIASIAVGRFYPDGRRDDTFAPGAGPDRWVNTLVIQPDGRIVLGGTFTSYDGTPAGRIVRLFADGSVDATFHTGEGANNAVDAIGLDRAGRLVVAGSFNRIGNQVRTGLGRLQPDGQLDSLNEDSLVAGQIWSVAVQPDDRILVQGGILSTGPQRTWTLARLNPDGTLDSIRRQWLVARPVAPPPGRAPVRRRMGSRPPRGVAQRPGPSLRGVLTRQRPHRANQPCRGVDSGPRLAGTRFPVPLANNLFVPLARLGDPGGLPRGCRLGRTCRCSVRCFLAPFLSPAGEPHTID